MGMHVAVVGGGDWSRTHLAALSESPHVARITLVARNQTSRDALQGEFVSIGAVSRELGPVLEDSSVDVVDIVLPHHLHCEVAHAALAAGKHVLCEKPASLALEDFDRLQATASSAERRFLVVMNQLYNPLNHRICQLVDAGALGRPFLLAENNYSQHAASYRNPNTWRTRVATCGGGVLIDGGYHMVYKHLAWLAAHGYPTWVSATTAQLAIDPEGVVRASQGEDFVSYTAGYAGPLRINASHAWTLAANPTQPQLGLLAGTEATLEITRDAAHPLLLHEGGAAASSPRVLEVEEGPRSNPETLRECLLDYLAALLEERPPAYGSEQLSRRTLQLILAIYQSSAAGQRVELSAP